LCKAGTNFTTQFSQNHFSTVFWRLKGSTKYYLQCIRGKNGRQTHSRIVFIPIACIIYMEICVCYNKFDLLKNIYQIYLNSYSDYHVTFLLIDEQYFNIFFFHTFNLSPFRVWFTLKTLIFYIDISVKWCYQEGWLITIINIISISISVHVYGDTKCCPTPLNATGIAVLPRSIKISSPISSL